MTERLEFGSKAAADSFREDVSPCSIIGPEGLMTGHLPQYHRDQQVAVEPR